jgi:microcystin-dependent protein
VSQPFVGLLSLVGFNFAPVNWAPCDGRLVAISENDTLFNLIGTTFGGDGQSTFALPDLRGRVTIHQGSGYVMGQRGGVESVTLNTNQLPSHNHGLMANSQAANGNNPVNSLFAATGQNKLYTNQTPATGLNGGMISLVGGSQPHSNMQPFLACNWIIALYGIYPSQG